MSGLATTPSWLIAVALALAAFAPAAHAEPAASDWFVTDQGRVRLIAGADSVGSGGDGIPLGLEFELKPHWKIYWRSPGDAGYPPRLDWNGSENLKSAALEWPAPMRFSVLGLETVGYENHVVLPIAANLKRPGGALGLKAKLSYLTCSEICVPYDGALTLDLPAGDSAPSRFAGLIARFAAHEPSHQQSAALAIASALAIPGARPMLELRIVADPPLAAPDVFVEGTGLAFGRPRRFAGVTKDEAVLRLPVSGASGGAVSLVGRALEVTLVDGDRALDATVAPILGEAPPDLGFFARMIGIALLGGFILNFMPCVLPVLAMKLANVAGAGGRARRHIRLGFLASAAGVIAAFLALAAATILAREAGVAVGWGMQFQEPLFLIAMMALLVLFAANLWGVFEVPPPRAIADWSGAGAGTGIVASFAAGAFATLLATPCSAPFLGTAIGFALASSPGEIALIFAALGIGLAAPYLAVAVAPVLVAWLPRPGVWMLTLRRVLGVALAATALWLAFVLAAESGAEAAIAAAILLALLAPALYLARRGRAALAAVLIALALVSPSVLQSPPPAPSLHDFWRPFDPAAITRLVGDGETVFVDVTADWCLTCKLNERLTIDNEAVKERLSAKGVVAMRADWTRPNAEIARYLRGFGRYGIPFNAVYGPALPQGRALPELLTPEAVAAALDRSREGG
jgi:suppressor for copper-sensitivity B